MKKIMLSIVVMFMTSIGVLAQNANRSGFFMEFGAGSFVVNPPIEKVTISYKQTGTQAPTSVTREELIEYESDVKYSATIGYRLATSRHWAIEMKANCLFGKELFDEMFMIMGMPGVRYTSPELFRNISLYSSLHLGIGARLDKSDFIHQPVAYGGDFELGINLSNKFYIASFLSVQNTKQSVEIYEYYISGNHINAYPYEYTDERIFSGVLGGKLGFRF